MIWGKKIREPKLDDLSILENNIIDCLIANLPDVKAWKIKQQLSYLKLIKRIEYKNTKATELYPRKFGTIPEEVLFQRKDEVKLARISFSIGSEKYISEIHMVLGQLFDLTIKPLPRKNISIKEAKFVKTEIFEEWL